MNNIILIYFCLFLITKRNIYLFILLKNISFLLIFKKLSSNKFFKKSNFLNKKTGLKIFVIKKKFTDRKYDR